MGRRLWRDIVIATAPVVVTVFLGLIGWTLIGTARGEFQGLTTADERRIVSEVQGYVDKQLGLVRGDISILRDDIKDLRRELSELLLELRDRKAVADASGGS